VDVSGDAFRPTVAQIEHVALATNDVERLHAFYALLGSVLSLPSTDPETGVRGSVLDFCGVRLELVEFSGLGHIGFALGSADAVDELTSVFVAAGYRLLEPPHRACELGCYESVVVDPDGNRVKLTV
jgi:lactoylglutathione lyase